MPRTRDHRSRVLVALMVSMALVAMDTTIVATAVPQVVGDLGGFTLVGWVFSAYLLAQTVTIPVYGKLADQYGRKPVLVVGVVIFLVGSALSAAAWTMVSLIAFRSLQGLGAGSIGATVNTIAGDLYDVRERGRIQGWLSSVWGVAAVVAPALGGVFVQYASWRWIFLVNLPLGALALTLIVRDLHERVERRAHRIDYAGSVLLLGAAGLLVLGLLQGGVAWPWLSVPGVLVFLASAACWVGAAAVERRAAEPVMPTWLWRRRLTAGSYAATATGGMLVIGLSTFLPTWGQSVLGLSAIAAGFLLSVMSLTWPTASAFSSRLYLRIGFRDTAVVGAVLTIAAGTVFVLVPAPAPIWQPVLGSALMGAGLGLLMTSLIVGLQSTVHWDQRGVITGGAMFSRFLGQSIGAAVFGAVTNAVLANRLASAPAGLRGDLPTQVDGISRTLAGGHEPGAVADYLRDALDASTHGVFLGLLTAGVLTLLILLLVPRRFPLVTDHDPADVERPT